MELHSKYQVPLVLLLLLPALCLSQGYTSSRATYYSTSDGYGTPTGACGYGDYGRTVNYGMVAGVSGLWRGGAGCGACYEVRCKDSKLCNQNGPTIVATDFGAGDRTDFIMSLNGFLKLGRDSSASQELKKYGVVDVEYKRVPCTHDGSNVLIKIHESSKYPDYLAIIILYVPGMKDVVGVEIYDDYSKEWRAMRRAFGAVFDIVNAPRGPFKLRLQFSGSKDWVESSKSVIPGDWKIGASYDSGIHA
ncbi:expansin-like B1 [Prosopis cineraria]|uniref:expansin-like B1 n=1 Tax=Prosopis cineraria TaxID=364024 RepID=UPI00240F5067|nr:expansin-like B1 [Prosopis cineraria]